MPTAFHEGHRKGGLVSAMSGGLVSAKRTGLYEGGPAVVAVEVAVLVIWPQHTPAFVSIRQHTSEYFSKVPSLSPT